MGCDCKFYNFFQFYHHRRTYQIILSMFIVVIRQSIFPFNFWFMYENCYFRLKTKSVHFMILRNFCFLFWNWQQVVIVSHGSRYIAICKLKCHYTKLHRKVKQIYTDKRNLHGQWAVGALSQFYKNLRIPFSETEKCNTATYIECRSKASTHTRQPVLILLL